ncbi:MAG TPA: hypothetical protein VNH11_11370 [Pirellulales bacterium]|nr:hypothetical protein [Pirellulales bacterium]
MLLTDYERSFLSVFIREATTDPFKGPVTEELHRRGIYYSDLSDLMAAYYRETPADQVAAFGEQSFTACSCPWPDREAVACRNHEVRSELEAMAKQAAL